MTASSENEEPYDFGFGRTEPLAEIKARGTDQLPPSAVNQATSGAISPDWATLKLNTPRTEPPEIEFREDGLAAIVQNMSRRDDVQAMLSRVIRVLLDHLGGEHQLNGMELLYIMGSQNHPEVAIERERNKPSKVCVLHEDLNSK